MKGKCCIDPNLYATGERLGKRAKLDALSATANECAHAAAPPPLSTTVHFPTRTPPSAASAGPTEGYLPHVNRSEAVPPIYLPSSSVPGLALLPFPATLPRHAFAPSLSTTAGSAYALSNAEMHFWA